ncbi:MAG: hypothetical protein ACYTXY_07070 [Nostoc sp.]
MTIFIELRSPTLGAKRDRNSSQTTLQNAPNLREAVQRASACPHLSEMWVTMRIYS